MAIINIRDEISPRLMEFANKTHLLSLTFITISNGKEINVVALFVKPEEAQPWVNRVYGHDEQYPNDPSLFRRIRVPTKMVIYLKQIKNMI